MPSKQSLMGDFERCAGSSPFCLGMVDFDCCGVKHKFDNHKQILLEVWPLEIRKKPLMIF